MLSETLLTALDMAGIVVFAASGALAAARKSMDIFGFIVISAITAVGGGTIRDLTLGLPVFWVHDNIYVVLATVTAIVVFFAESRIRSRLGLLTWLDAIGLALFAAIGAQKSLAAGSTGLIAIMMGIITAVFGGLIRDIICNEIPLILHREIYATAAFGAACLLVLGDSLGLGQGVTLAIATLGGFAIRSLAIVFGWSLPSPEQR